MIYYERLLVKYEYAKLSLSYDNFTLKIIA